jgi:hypothetical protein
MKNQNQNQNQKISFNAAEYGSEKSKLDRLLPVVERIGRTLQALKIDFTALTLSDLLQDVQGSLLPFTSKEFQKLAAMLKKDALDFPSEFAALIATVDAEKANRDLMIYADHFKIGEDGSISLDPTKMEAMQEGYMIRVENDIELKRWELSQEIASVLNKYSAFARELQIEIFQSHWESTVFNAVQFDGTVFTPRTAFVKKQVII